MLHLSCAFLMSNRNLDVPALGKLGFGVAGGPAPFGASAHPIGMRRPLYGQVYLTVHVSRRS